MKKMIIMMKVAEWKLKWRRIIRMKIKIDNVNRWYKKKLEPAQENWISKLLWNLEKSNEFKSGKQICRIVDLAFLQTVKLKECENMKNLSKNGKIKRKKNKWNMKTTKETLITRMFGTILEPFAKWQKLKSFSVIKITKITEWKDRGIWKSFFPFLFFF